MIYILCRQESETLTAIGLDISEASAKAMAGDGDFLVVPIQIGKVYDDIVSAGIVGAVTFENTSTKTIVEQIRTAILNIKDDITTLQGQVAAGNTAIQALDARVTALENP